MAEVRKELRYRLELRRSPRRGKPSGKNGLPIGAALPRISRLMALAIKLDTVLQQCPELDGWELAQRGRVSRSRITQILNLLHLAPDIQERLLWLPAVGKGREVITEKSLRRLAGEYHWERQRARFDPLLSRRAATGPAA